MKTKTFADIYPLMVAAATNELQPLISALKAPNEEPYPLTMGETPYAMAMDAAMTALSCAELQREAASMVITLPAELASYGIDRDLMPATIALSVLASEAFAGDEGVVAAGRWTLEECMASAASVIAARG